MNHTKLTLIFWILLMSPFLAFSQQKARLDHALRMSQMAHEQVTFSSSGKKQTTLARKDSEHLRAAFQKSLDQQNLDVIHAIVEFTGSRAELEAAGVAVGSKVSNYFTVELPVNRIEAVSQLPGMVTMEAARPVQYNLDDARAMVNADLANLQWKGDGVIVGLVDTGIDYTHPSFKNTNGTTRILYIWDQDDTSGGSPSPFNYGREWNASQINSSASTHKDTDGHGTSMAGIAAGNGREAGGTTPYIGVAPEADIIMVAGKRSYSDFLSERGTLTSTIIDGVSYIAQKAQSLNKPWVVNLSLGLDAGPRNGTSLFEKAIDAFVQSGIGEGRVIVTSAGNRGYVNSNPNSNEENRIHMDGSGSRTLEFNLDDVSASAPRSATMEIYYPAGSSYTFTLTSPNGIVYGPVSPGDLHISFIDGDPSDGAIIIDNTEQDIFYQGTDVICSIDFNDYQGGTSPQPVAMGDWSLQISGGSTTWDAYLVPGNGNTSAFYDLNSYTNRRIISEPGNVSSVITVGSVNSKNTWSNLGGTLSGYTIGDVSYFSAPGPTRGGLNKPEIFAPGAFVASALSVDRTPPQAGFYSDQSFEYYYTRGTSLSCAFVTGAAALILERGTQGMQYTPSQVKNFLIGSTSTNDILDVAMAVAGDPLGIEDGVRIYNKYQNDEILNLGQSYHFEANFVDHYPYGDYAVSYTWELFLEHSGGSYRAKSFSDGAGSNTDWFLQVNAANIPSGYSWTRSPDGHIEGKIVVTCQDNDGFHHSDQDVVQIKYAPNKPLIYSASRPDPTQVTLNYIAGGASSYKIYYDNNSGTPYSGTGLAQGSSPISVGTNVSTNLTGLDPNQDYYFAVVATNAEGNSAYSEEFVISDDPTSPPSGVNHQVDWIDLVGTSFSNGRLTKTNTNNWWNSGAASQNILPPYENGWVEYTIEAGSGRYRMMGLSTDNPNAAWNTIEHNMYLYNNGSNLKIYENGSFKINGSSYSTGDVVRVERSGSSIIYKKNGGTFYSSSTDPSKSLMVDLSMYSTGSFFTDMRSSFDDVYRVSWTDLVNASVSGNDLVKSTSVSSWWNAGAASTEIIPSGTNGYVQTVADDVNSYKMIGLSEQNSSHTWNSIQYNFYLKKGSIQIYQSGSFKCNCGTYQVGDRIKVEKAGGQILYKKNGATIYSSTVNAAKDMLVDVAIYTPGARFKEVVIKTEDPTIPITQSLDNLLIASFESEVSTTDSTLIDKTTLAFEAEVPVYANEFLATDSVTIDPDFIRIFPNPSRRKIHIRSKWLDLGQVTRADIQIVNARSGAVIPRRRYRMQTDDQKITIDISSLRQGVYSVILHEHGEEIVRKRFIKRN